MPVLMRRREVQTGVISYFQLQWARNGEIFNLPKIVVPYRTETNSFAYNDIEWYCRSDVYVITEKDEQYNLKYLLALLNSKIYFLWLYHRGKRKGEILELFQIPLCEIPIPKATENEQLDFANLADKITSIKQTGPEADTSALEAEIDRLIYELYGLTDDEIKIVEEAAK